MAPLDLTNPRDVTATIVILIEIILLLILLFARYNARRLKIQTHHKYVYTIVLVNVTIILTWMLPGELRILDLIFQGRIDPIAVWYVLFHALFGSIAIILGISICLIFLVKVLKQELLPLSLISKIKPLMITTFVFWLSAFVFGAIIYLNRYIVNFL